MLFTSYEFVAFMAIVFVLYYILPKKFQWQFLLISSYVFYILADWRYLLFVIATTISAYYVSISIEAVNSEAADYIKEYGKDLSKEEKKTYKAGIKARKWRRLLVCVVFNLGILLIVKYSGFIVDMILGGRITGANMPDADKAFSEVDMLVPMGISFYTLQILGYVIDVYREKQETQKNVFKLALFVSFFPQVVQGPISRYNDMESSLFAEHKCERKNVAFGFMRILWGYFKKLVIADRIAVAVNVLTQGHESYMGVYVFVVMMFYALQLYCDFTGGIDITIGIAESLGISITENFRLPYFSKNIKTYWKRWHITLGSWFTDYVFYPVSVCKPMLKFSKWGKKHFGEAIGKRIPVYMSAFAVWFLTGLWHGASWSFIVWGLMNFVVIMISQELEPFYTRFHKRFNCKGKAWYSVFEVIRTILLLSSLRLFDCYKDTVLAFKMFGSMFVNWNLGALADGSLLQIGMSAADYIVMFVGFLIVFCVSLIKLRTESLRELIYNKSSVGYVCIMALIVVVIIIFGAYGFGYDDSQFIYNQF